MKKILIAVAYHKKSFIVNNNIFLPIQVGAALSETDLGIVKDNGGENISTLNPYYCELSALYYLWKNYPDTDYLGLCHYRRFPTFQQQSLCNKLFQNGCYYASKILHLFNHGIRYTKTPYLTTDENSLDQKLNTFKQKLSSIIQKNKYDFFCTKHYFFSTYTIYERFAINCGSQHIESLRQIIEKYYPEYLSSLNKTLSSNKLRAANIAIFHKSLFNRYADFLFSILEHHLNLNVGNYSQNEYSRMYLRVGGYMAEILTDVFIRKLIDEGIKYKPFNILFIPPDNYNKQNLFVKFLTRKGFYIKLSKRCMTI